MPKPIARALSLDKSFPIEECTLHVWLTSYLYRGDVLPYIVTKQNLCYLVI